MRAGFILLICLCTTICHAQQQDQQEVNKTIDTFLQLLSFDDTTTLKIDSLATVFTADGKLIANFGKKPIVFTVSQYVETLHKSISSGQVWSSGEKELARKTDVFGKIAHVLSTYQLTIKNKEGTVVRRGLNSIQLVKQDGVWLIVSLIWDRETDTLKLPAKYL